MSEEKTLKPALLEALENLLAEATEPARERYLEASESGRSYRAEEITSADDTVTAGGDPRAAYATAKPRRRVIRARIAVD